MPDARETISAYLATLVDTSGDVELFPREDWRYEVDNGDTDAGYGGWVESKIEMETDTVIDAIDRLIHQAPRAFMTDGDEIHFNEVVLDVFGDLRMSDTEAPERARQFLQKEPGMMVYGETAGVLPMGMAEDVSRLAHLGMVAYEARTTSETIDRCIVDMASEHGLEGDGIDAARSRLGMDDNSPEP